MELYTHKSIDWTMLRRYKCFLRANIYGKCYVAVDQYLAFLPGKTHEWSVKNRVKSYVVDKSSRLNIWARVCNFLTSEVKDSQLNLKQ